MIILFFFLSPIPISIFQEFEKDQSPGPHLIENYHSLSLNKGQVARNYNLSFSISLAEVGGAIAGQYLY